MPLGRTGALEAGGAVDAIAVEIAAAEPAGIAEPGLRDPDLERREASQQTEEQREDLAVAEPRSREQGIPVQVITE